MAPNNNISLSQENFEKIEKYLSGEMTNAEMRAFEEQIKKDSSFKKLIEDQKILSQAIEEQSLRFKLNDFHKKTNTKVIALKPETKENKPTNSESIFIKLSIAASLAILIGLGAYLLFHQSPNPEQIFASNFKPDPGLPTTMGTTNEYTFYDAMVNYKRGKYDTAIQKWNTLIQKNPNNDTLNYFLGVSYLAKGNQEKAILFLNKNLSNTQSIFNKDALYYTALAKIKNNEIPEAKQLLKKVNSPKSKTLLRQLNDL